MTATDHFKPASGPGLLAGVKRVRGYLWAALLVLALGSGGVVLAVLHNRRPPAQEATEILVRVFERRRLIEPRLSGGFAAGEYDERRAEDYQGIDLDALERAEELLLPALSRGDDIGASHAHSRLQLARGRVSEPGTLSALRSLTARAPDSAEAHNDLGVCLLEIGELEEALDELNRALALRPEMREALFNRALCYGRLLLIEKEREDLHRLAQIEADPRWAAEIRQRAQALEVEPVDEDQSGKVEQFFAAGEAGDLDRAKEIAESYFEPIRTYVLRAPPVEYLSKSIAGDAAAAARALARLRLAGDVTAEIKGDRQIADAASYFEGLPASEHRRELRLLEAYLEAWRLFNDAVGSADNRRLVEAELEFRRLQQQFSARGNAVYATSSAYLRAQCRYEEKRVVESREIIDAAMPAAIERGWNYALSGMLNQRAIVRSRVGQDSLAIKDCEEALQFAAQAPYVRSKVLQFMSVAYWHIGDLDSALNRLRECQRLQLLSPWIPYRQRNLFYNCYQMARIYSEADRHYLARLYAEQGVKHAHLAGDDESVASGASFAGVQQARQGSHDSAEQLVSLALERLSRMREDRRRWATGAFVLRNAAMIALERRDPELALERLAAAETQAVRDETNQLPLIEILNARADANQAAGRLAQASESLSKAANLIEHYRGGLEPKDRTRFLDVRQAVFDELISLNVSLGKDALAFNTTERSRARTLLEEMSLAGASLTAAAVRPVTSNQVQTKLPQGLALLEYSVTKTRVLIFVVTRSRFAVIESPISADQLDREVSGFLSLVRSKTSSLEEVKRAGQELHRLLIAPVPKELVEGKTLCIVPDKILHFLPFSALVDESGGYLIESFAIKYAPSASVLLRCIEQQPAASVRGDEKVLAVGNPSFNQSGFPDLGRLPMAESEARAVASVYGASPIVSAEATEPTVRSAMQECDVVHLAVHCLVRENSPWLAALVLASESGADPGRPKQPAGGSLNNPNDGVLYLSELRSLRLPRTKLMVLSACQSGVGQYYRGEGIVSLVRPFLAAGVPTVVASLWPVESAASVQLMPSFHTERRAAGVAAASLQQAQTAMLSQGAFRHPYYWAPFIVIGGN